MINKIDFLFTKYDYTHNDYIKKYRLINDLPEPGNDPQFRIPVLAFLVLSFIVFPVVAGSMAQRSQCVPDP